MPHLMASSASSSSPTCTNAPSAHLHTESKMSHSSFHQLIRQGHLSTYGICHKVLNWIACVRTSCNNHTVGVKESMQHTLCISIHHSIAHSA